MSTPAALQMEVSNLHLGDHLCCIYETDEEHCALLTPFLRQGLERNEKVVCFLDARTAETVLGYLRLDGLDTRPFLDSGQLVILSVADTYMRGGMFDPGRMISLLRHEVDRSMSEGYQALRVAGDASWALKGLPGSKYLMEYESRLNNFFPGSGCLALCLYDRRLFPPELLLQGLATHPIAVIGTEIYENFHYVSPEKFLSRDFSAATLVHHIEGLQLRRSMKASEDALREFEEEIRAIFENSMDGILVTVPDGGILAANPTACKMLGGTEKDVCKSGRTGGVDLSDHRLPVLMEERARTGMCRGELTFVRMDGTKFPVDISSRVYEDRYGNPRTIDVFRDIAERKRAEEALRSSSDTLQALVHSSPLAIVTFDKDGNIGMWNPAAERMFGWWAEEVMGGPHPIIPEDKREEFREFREMVLGGRTFTGRELRRLRKDGSYIDISVSTAPLRDAAGSITSVMSIITDITQRKLGEEEKRILEQYVQRAQKMESLGVLAGGIAHDFNNLLMVVLGHAELALQEISPMSSAHGNLTEITTAARRAADLSLGMLTYAGKASFALERVGLGELIEEMAHRLKTAISKKAILTLNLERGLPRIEADPSQIHQIVMNLITNASEAIGEGGGVITVSVGATRCDEEYLRKTELHDGLAPGLYVHLEVIDTGIGMDEKTRARIFEPFFSTKFTGRGLGLAAVLGIIRAHRGALKVDSEPGKGTTIRVLFPALEDAGEEAPTNKSSPMADWRGKGTILLVDDEESLIALGTRMLEHLGFSVLTAADGLQAVELYRERGKEIDLVLMDLTMPHMDGAEAFGELRRLNPDAQAVIASGYTPGDVASRFAGKGLAGVLQKPYTLAKLRETLVGLMPARSTGNG